MTNLQTNQPVSSLHPLGNKTVKQGLPEQNSLQNNYETTVLKALADKVLRRNAQLNNSKTDAHMPVSRSYFTETKESIPDSYETADFEERIAIIQNDAVIPEAWAEAFARMDCMTRPTSISYKAWQNIINNTGLMLDNYIKDIIAHGWSVADIFGVHSIKLEKRYDCMGLLTLLGESHVVAVSADKITLLTKNDKTHGFYRMRVNNPAQKIMIWELS